MNGKRQAGLRSIGILALALAGAAWAAGETAWEREMAESRRPGMPAERSRIEWRKGRGMQERTPESARTACESVARAALGASGASIPAGTGWETSFATDEERVEVAEFRDGAGCVNRVAVYEQIGNRVPYYWTVEGEGSNAGSVAATAKKVLVAEGVLSRDDTEIAERSEEIVPPYERFRFKVLDDAPERDWVRPCRYVFEDADGSGFAVLWKKLPPRMRKRSTGEEIPWKGEKVVGVERSANALVRSKGRGRAFAWPGSAAGTEEEKPGGGATYFLLFSGGGSPKSNGIRFWGDTAMMYSTLTLTHKVPKERITVLLSDGTDTGLDANLGNFENAVLVDSPQDLDGDGECDVDGPASTAALRECLERLARTLGPEDCLWVFITSHGDYYGNIGTNNSSATISCWSDSFFGEEFKDVDFAQWLSGIRCPVAVSIETCFSGGFADDLLEQDNRAVATASRHFEVSRGWGGGIACWSDGNPQRGDSGTPGKVASANYWSQEFISALRGVFPANLDLARKDFPWVDGDGKVEADADGDGRVSFAEAAAWAERQDGAACPNDTHLWKGPGQCLWLYGTYPQDKDGCNPFEHPQYGESRPGLGEKMFLSGPSGTGEQGAGTREPRKKAPEEKEPEEGGGTDPFRFSIPKAAFKTNR